MKKKSHAGLGILLLSAVVVAPLCGIAQSFGAPSLWAHMRSDPRSLARTGDFNGDGKADIACFMRGGDADEGQGDVWVGISTQGTAGRPLEKWNDFLCIGEEIPLIGDFNGDGKDDVVVFIRSTKTDSGIGDVGVALSDGTGFGPLNKWHEDFCRERLVPAVGDVNGDGRDDILAFVKSNPYDDVAEGRVYVALSSGGRFEEASVWHDWFCIGSELPFVADFDGDRRADIATCIVADAGHQNGGTVYVSKALPEGRFGGSTVWSDSLGRGLQNIVMNTGDINGDGKADMFAFGRGASEAPFSAGCVVAAVSDGNRFSEGQPVTGGFCVGQEWPLIADINGDTKADLIKLGGQARSSAAQSGDIYFALNTSAPAAVAVIVPAAVPIAVPAAERQGATPVVAAVNVDAGWTFRMRELIIERGDETESEPYFVTLWFRGQLGVPGSTQTKLVAVGDPDWAANTPRALSRTIPKGLGEIKFGPAPILTRAQLESGEKPYVMGVVIAGYEHDGTSDSDIAAMAEEWRASAQQKLEMSLSRHSPAQMREAIRELSVVFGTLFAEGSTRMRARDGSLTDNDEYLSTCGRFWYGVEPGWFAEQLPEQQPDSWVRHLPLAPAHAQVMDERSDRLSFIGGAGRHHVGWTLEETP